MPDGSSTDFGTLRLDARPAEKALLKSWGAVIKGFLDGIDTKSVDRAVLKEHLAFRRKLKDSETKTFLGYVEKADSEGSGVIMLASIVKALVDEDLADYVDAEERDREIHRVRQNLLRRAEALRYFGLINRPKYGRDVALEMTEAGRILYAQYNNMFIEKTRSFLAMPVASIAQEGVPT